MSESAEAVVHGCPPLGEGFTPCCGRTPFELPMHHPVTTDPGQVTCRDKELAQLVAVVADTDDGESPFGWRELPDPQRASLLTDVLRAVRRQCAAWSQPTSVSNWDGRNRDLGVAVAARILIEVIDQAAPGIADEADDQDEVMQRPSLTDRFAAALTTTPRTSNADQGLNVLHGDGGHYYDVRCALCSSDADALASALVRSLLGSPLPHISSLTPPRSTAP